MLTATTLVFALLLSVLAVGAFTGEADAQNRNKCGYAALFDYDCADPLPYEGPFTNMPAAAEGNAPYGWGSLNPVAGGGDAGGSGGGAGGGLAHTGSSADVLGYVGAGLVAFGAVALGSRRKFFQGALD